jgi:P pilus assembly chaperone PapD
MFEKIKIATLSLIAALAIDIPKVMSQVHLGVSPPRFEVEMNNKARSQTINIMNFAPKAVEMRAFVRTWTMDENNELQDIQSSDQSLDQWIAFTPSRFTIPANGSQTIRFAIRPKVKPANGEHRAIIYIEEVPAQSKQNSSTVTTVARMGIVVYAYSGEVKRVGTINSMNVDTQGNGVRAIFDVSNTGNAHVRIKGQYAIWPAASYPGAKATQTIDNSANSGKLPKNVLGLGDLSSPPVLPANRRRLVLPITQKLPPGNYVLDINGEMSGVPLDTGIPFTVTSGGNSPRPKPNTTTSTSKS